VQVGALKTEREQWGAGQQRPRIGATSGIVGAGLARDWARWHQKERAIGAGLQPISDALGRLVEAQ
jgi:hypothetical protein